MLSNRQNIILRQLQSGPASSYTLAGLFFPAAPTASVRRDVQAIRRSGIRIDDARDNNGLYRLVAA